MLLKLDDVMSEENFEEEQEDEIHVQVGGKMTGIESRKIRLHDRVGQKWCVSGAWRSSSRTAESIFFMTLLAIYGLILRNSSFDAAQLPFQLCFKSIFK